MTGSQRLYSHFEHHPEPPEEGWQAARTFDSNPAYQYLARNLEDGTIQYSTEPHLVYNSHPQLYCIAPSKFPLFFKKAVKKIFGFDIDIDSAPQGQQDNNEDENKDKFAPFQEANDHGDTVASSQSEEDEITSKTNTNSSSSSNSSTTNRKSTSLPDPRPPARPNIMSDIDSLDGTASSTIVNDKGTVVHAVPLLSSNSKHRAQKQVELVKHIVPHGNNGCTLYVHPLSGMTSLNTGLTRSDRCDKTMILIHHLGSMANPKEIASAFTKGDHVIKHGKSNRAKELKLDPTDINVVNATNTFQETYGETVGGLATSSVFMPVKFKKSVRAKIKGFMASNKTYLPSKFVIQPKDITRDDGVRFLAFNIEYADSAEGTMNMSEDEKM